MPVASDGKYRFVRRIGRGGMGEVYDVEHVGLGRTLVAKLIHPELASDVRMLERVRVEAQALAGIEHPNVVGVTDLGATTDGRPFIVMEKLEGRTLADELRARRAIPVGEALAIAEQVLAALGAGHALGVVHRDIKPANIFLVGQTNPPLVKVLDWGIAKILPGRGDGRAPAPSKYPTAEGQIVGTPSYLAPEQVLGRAADERTDLYTAGLVLYRMLAGRGPWDDRGREEVLVAHVTEMPPLPSSFGSQPIRPELDAALMQALEKEPAQRYRSAEEFATALRTAGGAEAGRASWTSTEPLPTVAVKRGRGATIPLERRPATVEDSTTIALPPRRRGRGLALLVVALLLAAALAWFLVRP